MPNQEKSTKKAQKVTETEYIEEDVIVYVDIEQTSISESEIKAARSLNIVTGDKKSLLQLNNRFFEGKFDYSIGTHVFFERNEMSAVDPLYSHCDTEYDFKAKTNKILSMNRVLLKDATTDDELMPDNETQADDLKLTRTYEQALNLFLTQNRSAPRKVNEEDEKVLSSIIEAQMECEEEINNLADTFKRNDIKSPS